MIACRPVPALRATVRVASGAGRGPFAVLARAIGLGRRLCVARAGSTAVEFALLFPIMLLVYVGAAELCDGVNASRSENQLARTLVDLLAQQATAPQPTTPQTSPSSAPTNALTATQLGSLLGAATMMMAPHPIGSLGMTLSAIDITNNASGTCCSVAVRWSYTQNGTLRPCNVQIAGAPVGAPASPSSIPASLLPTSTSLTVPISLLVADVGYTYQPVFGLNVINLAPTMQRTEYTFPRTTGQVFAAGLPSSGPQTGQVCY